MSEWKVENGSETIYRTCAWSPPGCHPVGCGLRVHVEDGKITKVEGDPEHPITKGALCTRCLTLKEYIYHPDRVIYPMKRAREDRGLDKWERCSWDEALDIIEKNAKEIIENYGPESIMVFGGTGREGNSYYRFIANLAYGSPNSVYAQSGWSCYGPRTAVTGYLMGGGYPEIDYAQKFPERYDHPDFVAPEVILVWGKAPLESNGDGLWGHAIIEMMRRFGTKLIIVDPRVTWLGTRAAEVLQLRPGTDTALAMAMLDVMFTEGLYDRDFCDKWCWGTDEFAAAVHEMPPARAAEICGVPEEQIVRAGRLFGNAKPSSVAWGLAVDQNPNGVQLGQCLIALMAITGFLDAPGGTVLGSIENRNQKLGSSQSVSGYGTQKVENRSAQQAALDNDIMSLETWNKRVGLQEYPAVVLAIPTAHPDCALDALETGEPYEIHMAHFASSNPVGAAISSCPQRWYEALKKLDFCVVTDLFMNPTVMACCDVFLPLATCVEHDAVVATHYSLNCSFFGAVNEIVTVGECKSECDTMIAIGKRLFPDFWNRFDDEVDFDEWAGLDYGVDRKELQENVLLMTEEPYYKYAKGLIRADRSLGFNSPSGRIELYGTNYQRFGDEPLPYYQEPPFGPVTTPETMKEYPFVLTTGARTYASFHSEHRQIKSLRAIVPDPLLDMNPADAERLGLKEGDWAWIESPFGKCQQKVRVTPTIKEGVVHAMHGWSFPEQSGEEPNLFGGWKSNINVTMPHKVVGRMGFGGCFKNMICKIYPGDGVAERPDYDGVLEMLPAPGAAEAAFAEAKLSESVAAAALRPVTLTNPVK